MGSRAGLDGCGRSRPPLGFDPRTAHPVASRYTDCAIPLVRIVIIVFRLLVYVRVCIMSMCAAYKRHRIHHPNYR